MNINQVHFGIEPSNEKSIPIAFCVAEIALQCDIESIYICVQNIYGLLHKLMILQYAL